jgi:hypothetical protein
MPNSRRLDNIEEHVVVNYILDLAKQGFPPRLADTFSRSMTPVNASYEK